MTELPRGTVTFAFADIEGSTRLLHTHALPTRREAGGHDGHGRNDGRRHVVVLAWIVVFLVVLAAVVIGSIFVTCSVWRRGDASSSRRDAALDILKERYARGEIDRDEYEERRRVLQG